MNCSLRHTKRGSILLFFSLILSISLHSQNAQLILDPVNPFQKGSLFHLTLLNNSTYSGQVQLKASLKNRRGKILMVQETKQQINAGENKNIRGEGLQYAILQTDEDFGQLYRQSNRLPPMNYVLCISMNAIGDEALRTEECIEYMASDLINITSVYPPEDGEIGEQRPLFNWLNPDQQAPYTYNFRLVKLEKGQQPNAAMRRNIPLIAMDGINATQLLFPADAKPLENGEEYAWQLGINYNGEKVSETEASTFTYRESIEYVEIPRDLSYVDITAVDEGMALYAVGEFKFKYPSELETELKLDLYELKTKKKEQLQLSKNSFKAERGLNKYALDLKEQVYLKHLKDYVLIVRDQQTNNSYQLNIKYVNPEYIR